MLKKNIVNTVLSVGSNSKASVILCTLKLLTLNLFLFLQNHLKKNVVMGITAKSTLTVSLNIRKSANMATAVPKRGRTAQKCIPSTNLRKKLKKKLRK
jgi:hypothetical protein